MTEALHRQLHILYLRLASMPCGVTASVVEQKPGTFGSPSGGRAVGIPATHGHAAKEIKKLMLGRQCSNPRHGSAPSSIGPNPAVWILSAKTPLVRQNAARNPLSVQLVEWSDQERRCLDIDHELTNLLKKLPDPVAERLGLGSCAAHDSRTTFGPVSWVVALCRLGHLFPRAGLEVNRKTLTSGVVLSQLSEDTDFLTASAAGVFLLLDALRGTERDPPRPVARDEFTTLYEAFSGWGDRGNMKITWKRVRDLPSAPEGRSRSDDLATLPPITFLHAVLARGDAATVVCEVSGLGASAFHTLAARAGELLPRWPSTPYAAVLADPDALEQRLNSGANGSSMDQRSGCDWSDNCGMVTDYRSPVERWLGWVLETLTRSLPSALRLDRPPERNGEQTPVLSGFNPFTASAKAIKLARLIPDTDARDEGTPALAGGQSASHPNTGGGPPGGGSVRVAKSAGGSGTAGDGTIAQTEMVILEVLAKAMPRRLHIEEIQKRGWDKDTWPAKNTIRKYLYILMHDKELVCRSFGRKGGATLTTSGQEFIVQHLAKSSS